MRVAIIDIGTNSTRLLVTDIINNEIIPVLSTLESTRIGEGIGKNLEIKTQVLQRTLDCLNNYKDKCLSLDVQEIRVIATSAVRDASNRDQVVQMIEDITSLKVDVISGEKEAYLSFIGATSDEDISNDKDNLVVDIGGGSTELVSFSNNRLNCNSVKVGAVRLAENREIDNVNHVLKPLIMDIPKNFRLIGVGGTITSLAAIQLGLEKYDPNLIQGFVLNLAVIEKLYYDLSKMELEERKNVKGLQPKRADIIPFGIIILKNIMDLLNAQEVSVSEKDLMHGLIMEEFINKKSKYPSH
ncbi:exopolyphosphatase / guanosine-5'-triphosphate,3'-diphosphate pyrophosphatase [Desulfonispora thiosulfatigenes DSM 11270]|uniref:Exopolyphosphatase / guanosine-5'-triphosphate,3'-diphosphate pyrophosphatase n=1 Tax=Desulfonispora thiosulfatigenes DSM 11270 TaxID=656914 RepID=A0A1W1UZ58_DESTI|nr:Ppx/GppA phosphatase family protein [Desulfonispora thiosulfatigenes]SMB86387.1 exopolyphosphatase / guanosine-5'-triphosphate,3'-diphosphate pyrophosphatase [Desulfonispora thiosulfatigenes DSM 11270]